MRFLKQYIFIGILILIGAALYSKNPDNKLLSSGKNILGTVGITKEKVADSKIVTNAKEIISPKNNTIYKWKDEKGKWQYSNKPQTEDKNAVVHVSKEIGTISHVDIEVNEESQIQKIGNKIKSFLSIEHMTPVTESMQTEDNTQPEE